MATRIRQKAEKHAQEKKYPYAIAKYVRMSPSKITYILDLVRGKKAQEAVAILENMPDKGADESLNVLKSAIANAENNMGKNVETLFVKEAYATSGPQFKRMSARAKGSGNVILKKTSHITIVLDEVVGG
ncbi:MAG: 50S ribosomal protein L22 [Clostridiales bacterium]|nr:50S ribosomal protein L22 [Clostridiales bacterium]